MRIWSYQEGRWRLELRVSSSGPCAHEETEQPTGIYGLLRSWPTVSASALRLAFSPSFVLEKVDGKSRRRRTDSEEEGAKLQLREKLRTLWVQSWGFIMVLSLSRA